ncbi:DNA-binding transcriptional regulator DsdC [Acinetobacter seifertii]|nr:DNA-binding transcriptional regulator DsdC [Acinetobacter seifertii]
MNENYKNLNGSQLSKLITFEVAAKYESFALAAKELCLTPSAVSHQISSLENELDVQLFLRMHKKVVLTSDGKRIRDVLKNSLDILNSEIKLIKSSSIIGDLTVYVRPSFAQNWLIPKLPSFMEAFPHIELTILTGNENVDLYRENIDLAICFDKKPLNIKNYEFLMYEFITPVCTKEYAEKYQLKRDLINIYNCTLLHDLKATTDTNDTEEWDLWLRSFKLDTSKNIRKINFDTSENALAAAKKNLGIAMGRENIIKDDLLNQELIMPFPNKKIKTDYHYFISYLNKKPLPRTQIFISWLKENANK